MWYDNHGLKAISKVGPSSFPAGRQHALRGHVIACLELIHDSYLPLAQAKNWTPMTVRILRNTNFECQQVDRRSRVFHHQIRFHIHDQLNTRRPCVCKHHLYDAQYGIPQQPSLWMRSEPYQDGAGRKNWWDRRAGVFHSLAARSDGTCFVCKFSEYTHKARIA
jgi:hypothetical protein